MTAAVAPLPMPLQMADSTAEARKRRREILASQRSCALDESEKPSAVTPEVVAPEEPSTKRQKSESELSSAKSKGKKPQMKYDPDVPMTKEEAAAWRREQRRKRNRESAAASRQRQRDRISELEEEVEEWRTKFDSIMERIKKLEESARTSLDDCMTLEQSPPVAKFVSPPSSPVHSPFALSEVEPFPVSSCSLHSAAKVTPVKEKQLHGGAKQEHDKMISRQAASRIIHIFEL